MWEKFFSYHGYQYMFVLAKVGVKHQSIPVIVTGQ
jgi:hypothetical protein